MIRKINKWEGFKTSSSFHDNRKCGAYEDVWVDENDIVHNETNIPAWITYYDKENNFIVKKEFRKHGKKHNIYDGASIWYDKYSNITNRFYYLEGKELRKKEWEERTYIERNRVKMMEVI